VNIVSCRKLPLVFWPFYRYLFVFDTRIFQQSTKGSQNCSRRGTNLKGQSHIQALRVFRCFNVCQDILEAEKNKKSGPKVDVKLLQKLVHYTAQHWNHIDHKD